MRRCGSESWSIIRPGCTGHEGPLDMSAPNIGFLGFGEVGQRFAAALRAGHAELDLSTFDLLLHQAAAGDAMRRHAAAHRVELMADASAIADECTLIFSAVTADQALNAA